MAGSREVRFDIDVNAAKAEQGLRQFSRAVKRATKESEDGLDDTATAAEKVAKALKDMAEQMDTELRQAAKAADALSQALGPELTGRMDVDQTVADLNRMGLSFEEIETEAKTLGDSLKAIDGIRIDQANAGLDTMRTKLDGVSASSDQSRSVLANLAGNAAQDLGELGGVVGTLGVGIGQLAEYAVDGNIALSNLAKVAGPMAGLAAATLLLQQYMANIAKTKAFNEDEVESFADAIEEVGIGAQAVNEKLREAGEIVGLLEDSNPFTFFTDAEVDITSTLDKYGIALRDVQDVIADTAESVDFLALNIDGTMIGFHDVTPALEEFVGLMNALGVSGAEQTEIIRVLQQQQKNYRASVEGAAVANEFFASSLDDINNSINATEQFQRILDHNWGIILEDMRDGTVETQNAKGAWNILADALDLTNAEMTEMANQKLAEQTEAEAEAAEEAAEAQREHADAIRDAADAISEIRVDNIADVGSALTEALDVADAPVDLQVLKANLFDAFRELQTFIEENGAVDWSVVLGAGDTALTAGFDTQLAGIIQDVRDTFQTGIVDAFEQGGAPAAQAFVDAFLPQLIAAGMTPEQAYQLLGLPADGTVTALIQPLVDAQAKADAIAILNAIKGVDPTNPLIAALQIAIQQDTIPAEIAEVAALLLAQSLGIPVSLEGIPQSDIDAAQAVLDANPMTVPTVLAPPADLAGGAVSWFTGANALDPVTVPTEIDDNAEDELDDLVDEERTAVIFTTARTAAADRALDKTANPTATGREAIIWAEAKNTAAVDTALDTVAMPTDDGRVASIFAQATNTAAAAAALDAVAYPSPQRRAEIRSEANLSDIVGIETLLTSLERDRHVTVFVHTAGGNVPGVPVTPGPTMTPTGVAATTATTTGAPSAVTMTAAPVVQHTTTTINVRAGAVGNRFDVQRAVARAMRQSQRLNGRRVA